MAGILDKKTRILDTVITPVGRAQACAGDMRIEFASFTDRHAFYALTGSMTGTVNVADDASERLYFEAPAARFQDQICLEVAEEGQFQMTPGLCFPVKNVPGESNTLADAVGMGGFIEIDDHGHIMLEGKVAEDLKGDRLAVTGSLIAKQSRMNFKDQMMLHDRESIFHGKSLRLSTGSLKYMVGGKNLAEAKAAYMAGTTVTSKIGASSLLTNLVGFNEDVRLSGAPNFEYLPPINKLPPGVELRKVWPFLLLGVPLAGKEFESAKAEVMALPQFMPKYVINQGLGQLETFEASPSVEKRNVSPTGDNLSDLPLYLQVKVDELTNEDLASAKRCILTINPTLHRAMGEDEGPLAFSAKNPSSPFPAFAKYKREHLENGQEVKIIDSSRENNLMIQIFEQADDQLKKLSVIDFGLFQDNDPTVPGKRVFFAGKVYFDEGGTRQLKFANIFTVVFE